MVFRRLFHALLRRPGFWLLLFLWPGAMLFLVLAPVIAWTCDDALLLVLQGAAIATAAVALAAFGLIVFRLHRSVREIRDLLFQGELEAALDAARRSTLAGLGLGFESALSRLLEFDSRRAERVAATTRLVDSLLREAPVPLFVGDLEESLFRLNRALAELFDVADERFSLLAVLLLPANREFADLWQSLAAGEKTDAEATLALHLPVRRAARRLHVRLVAIQDDQGHVLYVLGFARHPEVAQPAAPPVPPPSATKHHMQFHKGSRELPQE